MRISIIILLISAIGQIFSADPVSITNPKSKNDSVLLDLSKEILEVIKEKDYNKLSEYIHPFDGVRFSPYGYIDTSTDIKSSRSDFNKNAYSNKKITWGSYDGSGDPIKLTYRKYFARFVYDADFLNAEKTSLNLCLGAGNSQNNIEAIYYGLPYTESYFSGFDEKYSGMDWRSLRLVYKEYEGKYYLVAIRHDEWTI